MGLRAGVQDGGLADVSQEAGQLVARRKPLARAYVSSTLLVMLFALGAWYWLQIMHECGHVLAAWATGGRVQALVLEFLSFSRTDVGPNPRPLVVVWAGPLVGVAIPALLWALVGSVRRSVASICGVFTGLCLVANGVYIAFGSIDGIGDAGEMIYHGTPRWVLRAVGAAFVAASFFVWHVLPAHPRPSRREFRYSAIGAFASAAILVALV